MSVEERLERLERQNQWMRRLGAVVVALVVAVFLMGQGKKKELPDLEVRSLTVKDKDGNVRARLWTSGPQGAAGLLLMAKDGRARAGFSTTADGSTTLQIMDKTVNTTRVMLYLLNGSPVVSFFDKDGKPRVVLDFFRAGGSPSLTFYDATGKVILWQAPKK